jgi:hypothetical protein
MEGQNRIVIAKDSDSYGEGTLGDVHQRIYYY